MKLNLGCGKTHLEGFVNVDYRASPSVDQVVDLTVHPWPWLDNSVDYIIASHFLEHLPGYELGAAMDEIHRILRPGGTLYVAVPYRERGPYNPYHFHVFNRQTFNTWTAHVDKRDPSAENACLQAHHGSFRRAKQEVASRSGFPVYHFVHYLPWSEGILFRRDDHGAAYSRFPSRVRELREWLEKIADSAPQ